MEESSSDMLFPQFRELPPELRIQVWRDAISNAAPVGRTIRVDIHPQLEMTTHSCVAANTRFCGRHGSCARYRPGATTNGWNFPVYSMVDGYYLVVGALRRRRVRPPGESRPRLPRVPRASPLAVHHGPPCASTWACGSGSGSIPAAAP